MSMNEEGKQLYLKIVKMAQSDDKKSVNCTDSRQSDLDIRKRLFNTTEEKTVKNKNNILTTEETNMLDFININSTNNQTNTKGKKLILSISRRNSFEEDCFSSQSSKSKMLSWSKTVNESEKTRDYTSIVNREISTGSVCIDMENSNKKQEESASNFSQTARNAIILFNEAQLPSNLPLNESSTTDMANVFREKIESSKEEFSSNNKTKSSNKDQEKKKQEKKLKTSCARELFMNPELIKKRTEFTPTIDQKKISKILIQQSKTKKIQIRKVQNYLDYFEKCLKENSRLTPIQENLNPFDENQSSCITSEKAFSNQSSYDSESSINEFSSTQQLSVAAKKPVLLSFTPKLINSSQKQELQNQEEQKLKNFINLTQISDSRQKDSQVSSLNLFDPSINDSSRFLKLTNKIQYRDFQPSCLKQQSSNQNDRQKFLGQLSLETIMSSRNLNLNQTNLEKETEGKEQETAQQITIFNCMQLKFQTAIEDTESNYIGCGLDREIQLNSLKKRQSFDQKGSIKCFKIEAPKNPLSDNESETSSRLKQSATKKIKGLLCQKNQIDKKNNSKTSHKHMGNETMPVFTQQDQDKPINQQSTFIDDSQKKMNKVINTSKISSSVREVDLPQLQMKFQVKSQKKRNQRQSTSMGDNELRSILKEKDENFFLTNQVYNQNSAQKNQGQCIFDNQSDLHLSKYDQISDNDQENVLSCHQDPIQMGISVKSLKEQTNFLQQEIQSQGQNGSLKSNLQILEQTKIRQSVLKSDSEFSKSDTQFYPSKTTSSAFAGNFFSQQNSFHLKKISFIRNESPYQNFDFKSVEVEEVKDFSTDFKKVPQSLNEVFCSPFKSFIQTETQTLRQSLIQQEAQLPQSNKKDRFLDSNFVRKKITPLKVGTNNMQDFTIQTTFLAPQQIIEKEINYHAQIQQNGIHRRHFSQQIYDQPYYTRGIKINFDQNKLKPAVKFIPVATSSSARKRQHIKSARIRMNSSFQDQKLKNLCQTISLFPQSDNQTQLNSSHIGKQDQSQSKSLYMDQTEDSETPQKQSQLTIKTCRKNGPQSVRLTLNEKFSDCLK